MRERKNNPELIEQHATSLCGTAALLYQFAMDYPTTFYEKYMEFFRTGNVTINTFVLNPNSSLFEMKPDSANNYPNYDKYSNGESINPPLLMKYADWVILAGTRSADNKDYEGKQGEDWDAINWPNYMKKAAIQLYGATTAIDNTFIITGKDFTKKLKKIEDLYKAGWKIVLLIDSDMLNNSVSWFGCATQYHWIVYEGGLQITNTNFIFSYWCYHERNTKVAFRKKVFNTNFYGYIKYK